MYFGGIIQSKNLISVTVSAATFLSISLSTLTAQNTAVKRFDHGSPSNYEQLALELINRARMDPKAESARLKIDLEPSQYPYDSIDGSIYIPKEPISFAKLDNYSASLHNLDMLKRGFFSHTNPDGLSRKERMLRDGHTPKSAGENIAYFAQNFAFEDKASIIEEFHKNFLKSRGHRITMLAPIVNQVGIALDDQKSSIYKYGYDTVTTTQIYQEMGIRRSHLTGVVYTDEDNDRFYSPGEGYSGVKVSIIGEEYYGTSSSSGGYSVPFQEGNDIGKVMVTIEGKRINKLIEVELSDENHKLDIDPEELTDWIQHPSYGWIAESGEGWYFSEELGFLYFFNNFTWAWSHTNQTWLFGEIEISNNGYLFHWTKREWVDFALEVPAIKAIKVISRSKIETL